MNRSMVFVATGHHFGRLSFVYDNLRVKFTYRQELIGLKFKIIHRWISVKENKWQNHEQNLKGTLDEKSIY